MKDDWNFRVGGPLQGSQNHEQQFVGEYAESSHCTLVLTCLLFHENMTVVGGALLF